MPVAPNTRRSVDLDEHDLAKVPFGRNRFLRALGIALFGLTVQSILPQTVAAAPYPCFGYPTCSCCSGHNCCASGCCAVTGHSHCPGGGQCWYVCTGGGMFKCCDYHYGCPSNCSTCGSANPYTKHCICSGIVSVC